MILPRVLEQVRRHEGFRQFPYRDTVGKLTIGIGRNLDDVGITRQEAEFLLGNDLAKCHEKIRKWPWWDSLNPPRQGVLLNMCFNLGFGGLSRFRNTLARIEAGDWEGASRGMLKSKWARQVGRRAQELAEQMRTGEWQ